MKTCVIFNPAARGEKARRFQAQLGEWARQVTLRPTTGPGAAAALAEAAVAEGFELIVAAGGDGTVNEVLNGIGAAPDGFEQVRFGILPLGTINVFARELGLPASLHRARQVLETGRERRVDLGIAEFVSKGQKQHRFFAQMAGAGWDARAIELVRWEMKKRYGPAAYVFAGLQALRGTQPMITASSGSVSYSGPLVLIGNGRFYGGSWPVFPLADLEDGVLEVTIFPNLSWLGVVRGCIGVFSHRLHQLGGVHHFRAARVEVTSLSPQPFHVEGENSGHLPVTFSLRPKALRVIGR